LDSPSLRADDTTAAVPAPYAPDPMAASPSLTNAILPGPSLEFKALGFDVVLGPKTAACTRCRDPDEEALAAQRLLVPVAPPPTLMVDGERALWFENDISSFRSLAPSSAFRVV
jgi:hypothetical protein